LEKRGKRSVHAELLLAGFCRLKAFRVLLAGQPNLIADNLKFERISGYFVMYKTDEWKPEKV
jgi:hypothetical protein